MEKNNMVKIEEHIKKMNDIKKQADNSKGNKKLQLLKCYHRLQKQLLEYKMYQKGVIKWKKQ
jgi:hypothetical protein